MKPNKTVRLSVAALGSLALGFLALGYLGVQYNGRNNMFTIAFSVGGAGAISYVLHPTSQPSAPATPVKTQRRRNKS